MSPISRRRFRAKAFMIIGPRLIGDLSATDQRCDLVAAFVKPCRDLYMYNLSVFYFQSWRGYSAVASSVRLGFYERRHKQQEFIFWSYACLIIAYSTDFHHLYNHSIHHSLTTHLHSGTVAVPVRSLSGSIIGIIGMISVIPFHSMRAIAELQKKV